VSCRLTALLKFMVVNNLIRQWGTKFNIKCQYWPAHTAAVS